MGVIYKITNLINGEAYIGQTINFERRKKEHLKAKDNFAIHNAIRKYGIDNFSWEILEECSENLLNEREKYWISYYNTYKEGYNSTRGGENAEALIQWRKTHLKECEQQLKQAREKAQQYNIEHKKEVLERLSKVRQKGTDAIKRKVCCIEKNIIFDSISEAERWSLTEGNDYHTLIRHQHISRVCRGQRKTAGGYHWKYVD